ncbi:winged helix-turn-helix domain-containing protein, partial [Candidatus Clostridium helianthi]
CFVHFILMDIFHNKLFWEFHFATYILSFLINNKGNIVKRDSLMEYLWKADFFVDDSTLNVNINRLRKKLEEIGIENPIETRRGMGYIMP